MPFYKSMKIKWNNSITKLTYYQIVILKTSFNFEFECKRGKKRIKYDKI
jgi:hypothetical protein